MHYRNGTTRAIARALGLVSGAMGRLEGLNSGRNASETEWCSSTGALWEQLENRGIISNKLQTELEPVTKLTLAVAQQR
eukprot:COSAG02_NODE_27879_length_601_cov_0.615538_2_plen_79_part_00